MPYTLRRIFEAEKPERLDRVLSLLCQSDDTLRDLSRSHLQGCIEAGAVTINGRVSMKAGVRIEPGSVVELRYERSAPEHLVPLDLPLTVVSEDDWLIVIDKPAGLTVHPGAGNRTETLVNALIARGGVERSGFPDAERPGIVHRLDKDTSGLIVVAKNPVSHERLSRQFAAHTAYRQYVALVYAAPRRKTIFSIEDSGVVDAPIGRDPRHRRRMAVVPEGRRAVTHWKVRERMTFGTLVEFRLETGRTHQIRVHAAHSGAPVVADSVYGRIPDGLPRELERRIAAFGRQALHAETLTLQHPQTGAELRFAAPLPKDLAELIAQFREA